METTDKTTEPQLREFEAARVITGAKIVKTDEGYVLVVQVSWRKGDLVVFNQRGKPRAWASMDRLLRYIEEVTPSVGRIDLVLEKGAEQADARPDTPAKKVAAKPVAKKPLKPAKKRPLKAGAKKAAKAPRASGRVRPRAAAL
jgi:D-alanyl-D-alanine carboxypeptidase